MIAGVNALLYVSALTLAVLVVSPLPEGACRRVRVARAVLICGGGVAVTAAIALGFAGRWYESAVVGLVTILIVSLCMCLGLSRMPSQPDDDEDDDDDGGGRRHPPPPAPTQPVGGPPNDLWDDFDATRDAWERDREREREREPVGV